MQNNKKILLILLLTISVLLSGCQIPGFKPKSQAAKKPAEIQQTPSQQSNTTTQAPEEKTPAPEPANSIVPNESTNSVKTQVKNTDALRLLDAIEYDSANILFDVIKLDWDTARKRFGVIKENSTKLIPAFDPSAQKNQMDELLTSISNLEKSINSNKVNDAKEAANSVTKAVADAEDSFDAGFPTDLCRINYLSREIHINVNQGNWSSASSNYKAAADLWKKVETKVDSKYKSDEDEFVKTFTKLGTAVGKKDAKLTVTASNELIWNVVTLKNDFINVLKN